MRSTSFILLIFTTCASIASAAPFVEAPPQGSTFSDPAKDISGSDKLEQEADLPDDSSLSTRALTGGQEAGIAVGLFIWAVIAIQIAHCICPDPGRRRRRPVDRQTVPTVPDGNPPPYNGPHDEFIVVDFDSSHSMNEVRCPPPPYNPGFPTGGGHGSLHPPEPPPPAYNPLPPPRGGSPPPV